MDQYPDPAASWLLLRALGALQGARDGVPITDMDALACTAGLRFSQLPRLIATSILAGWIEEDEDGALGLTAGGWAAIAASESPLRRRPSTCSRDGAQDESETPSS